MLDKDTSQLQQAIDDYQEPSEIARWGRIIGRQLLLQLALGLIAITVVFPVVWIIAISLDSRNLPQYTELLLVPDSISFRAFEKLLFEPFDILSSPSQEVYFTHLLSNSLFVALGTAMLSVGLGASAAYAFSRFRFIGRQAGMLGFIVLLMMPATGTLVPLIAIFSLLKVHVVFSSVAPALFFGCLAALAVFGLNAGLKTFLGRDWAKDDVGQWIAGGIVIVFVFGLVFLGWMMMFRESDVYDEAIREPLRDTNSMADELQDITVNIPRRERNIDRQVRFLEDREQELANVSDYFREVETDFPNAYAFVNGMRAVNDDLSAATYQGLTLADVAVSDDALEVRRVALQAEVVDQAAKVADAEQEVADLKALRVETEATLDDLRSPIYELRNDVILRLLPYILATTLFAVVVATGIWFGFNRLIETDVKLIRDVWFGRVTIIGYLIVVALITYGWFTANYSSPTEQVGLEDGGLWYDIKLAFRDEEEIREELEPYNERIKLEQAAFFLRVPQIIDAVDNASGAGLDSELKVQAIYLASLQEELLGLEQARTRLELIDTTLDPPVNLSRTEAIEWKDAERERIRGELEDIRRDASFLGRLSQLNLLNNQNFKNEFMEIIRNRRGEVEESLQIVINSSDADQVVNAFQQQLSASQLDGVVALLQAEGLSGYESVRVAELRDLASVRSQLELVDTDFVAPDDMTTEEAEQWEADKRAEANSQINKVVEDAPLLLGDLSHLAELRAEDRKAELMALLQERIDQIGNEFEIIARNASASEAIAAFQVEIDKLPADSAEEDRLRKELAIRGGTDLNVSQQLKTTLFGLMIAYCSGALPFAIWNLKGYFDTIPKDLEEAALVDGANLVTSFIRVILPLSLPALAITTLFSFMTGWTEFILAWQFINDEERHTLAMALRGISGGGETQAQPDYTEFAAMSILMAIPVVVMFYIFQRWIVSGLTVGGVKG